MPVSFSKSVVCCCSLCRILLYAVAGIYMKKNKKKKKEKRKKQNMYMIYVTLRTKPICVLVCRKEEGVMRECVCVWREKNKDSNAIEEKKNMREWEREKAWEIEQPRANTFCFQKECDKDFNTIYYNKNFNVRNIAPLSSLYIYIHFEHWSPSSWFELVRFQRLKFI